MFSCEFCEIFRNTFFTEPLWTTASVCSKTVKGQRRTKLLTCCQKLRVERQRERERERETERDRERQRETERGAANLTAFKPLY